MHIQPNRTGISSSPCRTARTRQSDPGLETTTGFWKQRAAAGGSPSAKPVVIPATIGDPSKIKHVFVIIRENRTYDQILGDVAGGNGDPTLAVFGDTATLRRIPGRTPNAHALVQRFPLLDNFYDPSRQSADGHNWILQAMAPYSDDIQSPDWLRDYPSNGGDAHCLPEEGPPVGCGGRSRRLDQELRRVHRVQHVQPAEWLYDEIDPRNYDLEMYRSTSSPCAVRCFEQLRADLGAVLQRHTGSTRAARRRSSSTTTPSPRTPRSRT